MNSKSIEISGRRIVVGEPTLVIAEIGVNHDGSVTKALELVDTAAQCQADAVKLQLFRASHLMNRSSSFAAYQKAQCDETDPPTMLRKYELAPDDIERIVYAIRQRGMLPLATPFSIRDVATIDTLNLPAVKIASPDMVNRPLLMQAARLGKPLLISTGAASMDEVSQAADWMRSWDAPFALLHCVSSYPTPSREA